MAKKLKDYYENYIKDLGDKIYLETDKFNYKEFIKDVMADLKDLEFNNRQILIAKNVSG